MNIDEKNKHIKRYKEKNLGIYDKYTRKYYRAFLINGRISGRWNYYVVMGKTAMEADELLENIIDNLFGVRFDDCPEIRDISKEMLEFKWNTPGALTNPIELKNNPENIGFDMKLVNILLKNETLWIGDIVQKKEFMGIFVSEREKNYHIRKRNEEQKNKTIIGRGINQ